MNENTSELSSLEYASNAYKELAKYVAKTRAYPSTVDGLKHVERRILYASIKYNKFIKSATIVGDSIKYHPHSSDAIYGSLVSMTGTYSSFPLFNGKGNFGGLGYGAASFRYTECYPNEISRLLYTEISDYSKFEEGETGLGEPTYLPALIPYALLTGSTAIPVGLPVPNIPRYNIKDLIRYFRSKLKGEIITEYPRVDYGKVIIQSSRSEVENLSKSGTQRIIYKPFIIKEDDKTISLSELPPHIYIWKLIEKLQSYIDTGIIDYIDETTDKYRWVFKVNDERKLSLDQLIDKINKICTVKETYNLIFTDEYGKVLITDLENVSNKCISYYKSCLDRKFKNDLEYYKNKLKVYTAIDDYRQSSYFNDLPKKSKDELIKDIMSLRYELDIAESVIKKPISYLSRAHESEKDELNNKIKEIEYNSSHIIEYMDGLYEKLDNMINDWYNSNDHSIYESDNINKVNGIYLSGKYLYPTKRTSKNIQRVDKFVYLIDKTNGHYIKRFIDRTSLEPVELDSENYIMISDECMNKNKYLILIDSNSSIIVEDTNNLKDWSFVSHLDNELISFKLTDKEKLLAIDEDNSKTCELTLKDWITKRRVKPRSMWMISKLDRFEDVN